MEEGLNEGRMEEGREERKEGKQMQKRTRNG